MFSIIMPIDTNRLEQFSKTKRAYDTMPQVKEFVMPTRSYEPVKAYLEANSLMRDVRLIRYTHKIGFNPSKALNIGARKARYSSLIVTSPEVMPMTNVLAQLAEVVGTNVVCQVSDENERHELAASLVHTGYRDTTPAMYFLAMFNKADVEAINGWDEEFMRGYAYEDNDFGERWKRAGLPFSVRDDIKARHQYHPRAETIPSGAAINFQRLCDNNDQHIIRPKRGLVSE